MLIQALALGFLIGDQIYHRWFDDSPKGPRPPGQDIQIPRTDEGAPIPLVFGRCKVRAPILVWIGNPEFVDVYLENDSNPPLYTTDDEDATPSHRTYAFDMLFTIGIPMGSGVTRGNSLAGPLLHNVWWGEYKLPTSGALPNFTTSLFYGQMVVQPNRFGGPARGGGLRGAYYFFGGWTDQDFTSPASRVGDRMTAWGASRIAGLKRQMCISFNKLTEDSGDPYFNITHGDGGAGSSLAVPYPDNGFVFGESPTVEAVSVEVSTYGDILDDVTGQHIFSMRHEGVDFDGGADPAEVIYDILTGKFGKLALDPSLIDLTSFAAASQTLKSEGNGYARAVESPTTARELINDVLEQIDGVLYGNQDSGKQILKLIRNDYNPNDILVISKDNCVKLTNFAAGGRTNLINKVRVTYERRDSTTGEYVQDSAIAKNPANAVGQNTQENEAVIDRPGVKTAVLAANIAARELAFRSRPIIKCRAIVDPMVFGNVNPGDALKLVWTNPDIAGLVFRVAKVDRGTLEDGLIALDLIQDFYYVWRNGIPIPPWRPPAVIEI